MAQYMAERATQGAFFIAEATFMAARAAGFPLRNPGIWREDQVSGWKKVMILEHILFLILIGFYRVSV